jgi:hypothetical protein
MLECIRVLVNTPGWSPSYSIIFCALCPSLFADYFRVPRCPLLQYSTMPRNRYKTAHIYSRRSILSLLREYPLPILVSLIFGTDTVTAPSVRAAINLEGTTVTCRAGAPSLPCVSVFINAYLLVSVCRDTSVCPPTARGCLDGADTIRAAFVPYHRVKSNLTNHVWAWIHGQHPHEYDESTSFY